MPKAYKSARFMGDEKCRYCYHTAYDHMSVWGFGSAAMEATWCKCTKPAVNCFCPGFGPVDNLDFLAFKHEQKEAEGADRTIG